jgi:hypothetical protein
MSDGFEERLAHMLHKPDDKSVMLHELRAFWEFSKPFVLDRIVESGTYKGLTAKRLSLLYPNCKIYSFEKRRERYNAIPSAHYADNIRFKHGILRLKYITPTTAVLIDGPKRLEAISLARKCRKTAPFVAIHDMMDYYDLLKKNFDEVQMTGDLAICV